MTKIVGKPFDELSSALDELIEYCKNNDVRYMTIEDSIVGSCKEVKECVVVKLRSHLGINLKKK